MKEKKIIKQQENLRIFFVRSYSKLKKLKKKYILPFEVRIKKVCEKDGFKIFLVDGYKIRHFIDFDFTMGGHGFRYMYIPLNEIWIDSSNESELDEIMLHELIEAKLMRKGKGYENSHVISSVKELELRNEKIILPAGHHRQVNEWSCGPSSLKIVLDYFNDKKSINLLIKKTGCDKTGTLHKGFRKALKAFEYKFYEKKNSSIKDIENFIQKAIPVIVDYQAYHGGHFSAVIGYDRTRFLLSDPAYNKKFKWVSKKDFEKKWWEEDEPGKIVKKWMLAVYKR